MNVRDKVLIVEDDEGIRKFLSTTLIANGYSVILADDGKSALELVSSHCPVCILLDLGLPDIDGNEIIRSIRSWTSIPILVISARTTEDDKAGALDLGADDYLTKPFSTVELLARIRTALRHARTPAGNDELSLTGGYHVGELTVDMRKHRVFLAGRDVGLTPNEFRIVSLLAAHAGQVLTYKYILRELWGPAASSDNKILRVHMANIRRKLEQNPADLAVLDVYMPLFTGLELLHALRGQGVAGQLMEAAVDQIRSEGLKARPICSYAAKWFEKHPEQGDLL